MTNMTKADKERYKKLLDNFFTCKENFWKEFDNFVYYYNRYVQIERNAQNLINAIFELNVAGHYWRNLKSLDKAEKKLRTTSADKSCLRGRIEKRTVYSLYPSLYNYGLSMHSIVYEMNYWLESTSLEEDDNKFMRLLNETSIENMHFVFYGNGFDSKYMKSMLSRYINSIEKIICFGYRIVLDS